MLDSFRKSLPIFSQRDKLLKSIKNNQMCIIAGQTGCGKTTQVPQYIWEENHCNIAVTQPRRVAAMTLAERCSQEKGTELGDLIGYNVRFDDKTSSKTQITFLTDGMLIREQIIDPVLNKYKVIIIDEAHERTVQSDLLLALLKGLCKKRKDLKLILMSATLQLEKFASYLQTSSVHMVEGRTYPIDVYNTNTRQADYVESMVNTILQIHLTAGQGDILAFLTGQDDIEDTAQIIEERMKKSEGQKLVVKKLYSALPAEVQMEAFQGVQGRKVVLSTNIAETSVTIDGIVYVIDCGYVKIRTFQSNRAIDTLLLAPISKSQAEQRAGRAGRQRHGQCYRLYTHATYEQLAKFMMPEILRTNLQSVILQMKAIGIKNILKFDFIDQPNMELMLYNLQQLQRLNALDEDYNLTQHGIDMSTLPLEPQFSNFLLKAWDNGIQLLALNSVAMMEIDNLFFTKDQSNKILLRFKAYNSDHLTKANIMRKYEEAHNKKSFCKENLLNQKALKKAQEIKQQLLTYLQKIKKGRKMEIELHDIEAVDKFKQLLSESLIFKHAVYSPQDLGYMLKGSNQLAHIHPESTLFNQKPKFLIYNEVILTKKVYLRDVTEVDQLQI